jgi:hypothetical protein
LEIKTAAYKDDWIAEDGSMRVPLYYQTQVQWYLSTLGLDWAYLAVLFSGREYHEFEITTDSFQQSVDIELVEKFLQHLGSQTEPGAPFAAEQGNVIPHLLMQGNFGEFMGDQHRSIEADHPRSKKLSSISERLDHG